MKRPIKTTLLIKTDPIDGTFMDAEVYGNLKHLQETALQEIPYNKIWKAIKEKGLFVTEKGQHAITVIPRDLQRGERKSA